MLAAATWSALLIERLVNAETLAVAPTTGWLMLVCATCVIAIVRATCRIGAAAPAARPVVREGIG